MSRTRRVEPQALAPGPTRRWAAALLLLACRTPLAEEGVTRPGAATGVEPAPEPPPPTTNADGTPRRLPPSAPDVPGRVLVLPYEAFGPQSMAWELLGMERYSWPRSACCGDPEDASDIRVVVHVGVSEAEVRARYPTVERQADHRLIPADRARELLRGQLEGLDGAHEPLLADLRAHLGRTLAAVDSLMAASAPRPCGDGTWLEALCDPGVVIDHSESGEGAGVRFLARSPLWRVDPDRALVQVYLPDGGGGRGDGALVAWVKGAGGTPGEPTRPAVAWARRAVPFTTATGRGVAYQGEAGGRVFLVQTLADHDDPPGMATATERVLGSLRLTKAAVALLSSGGPTD